MQKKNLILVFLVVLLAGMFLYPRIFNKVEAVGISDVTADPSKYVGKTMTLSGAVSEVYPEDSVIYIADDAGCCTIPILVPFTQEQQKVLELSTLYSGTLPAVGQYLDATGTLKSEGAYFIFDIDTVSRNGQVIINKVQ